MRKVFSDNSLTLWNGDAVQVLRQLPDESVHCCVTSPPYFGLRDYGVEGQIGMEKTPEEFIEKLVAVFREVRRVIRHDGTLWVNIGDSYNSGSSGSLEGSTITGGQANQAQSNRNGRRLLQGLKPKDLIGIPWMLAFALRADGWFLRQEIIWHKPNPMPESVKDRCTKSHEQVFLLSKSPNYYFDQEAIKEPIKDASIARLLSEKAVKFGGENPCPDTRLQSGKAWSPTMAGGGSKVNGHSGYFDKNGNPLCGTMVNKKSVWTVTTRGYKEAHFAVYPPELIRPCVLAGCPPGGVVLDPFAGSGTTAEAANQLGRKAVLIEINLEYCELVLKRNCQAVMFT